MTMAAREFTRGICYFNHGTKCLVRLAVSLFSLRKVYSGPVAVLDAGESDGIAERIARDERLAGVGGTLLKAVPIYQQPKHSAVCAKPTLWRHSPFDVSLLLDSDTAVAGDPSLLLDLAEDPSGPGILFTRFSNWTTHREEVAWRLRRWRGVRCDRVNVAGLLRKATECPRPALNAGVVAWRRDAAMLPMWEQLTKAGWRCSLPEELAAQLLAAVYPYVLVDDRYNCSPIHGQNREKVCIWHFHGNRQCQPEALPIWWPLYQECLELNIGGIREWTPAGDKRLAEHLAIAAGTRN
jgi:hypothetical protein